MPEKIKSSRNIAIILGFAEFICCLMSIFFYARRRSRLVLGFIFFNCIATICGFMAKLTLSYCGLLLHAIYSISFVGGLYIYIIIDFLFANENLKDKDIRLSETVILIISSLPLFGLFCMGIYSLILLLKIDEELEARKKANERKTDRVEGIIDENNAHRNINAPRPIVVPSGYQIVPLSVINC